MKDAIVRQLEEHRPSLRTCPVCPVKGTCVFVTPGYEPGYCLHEYKLMHAYLAQRLRAHPPAGASQFSTALQEVRRRFDSMRLEPDPASSRRLMSKDVLWDPRQPTLDAFGASTSRR